MQEGVISIDEFYANYDRAIKFNDSIPAEYRHDPVIRTNMAWANIRKDNIVHNYYLYYHPVGTNAKADSIYHDYKDIPITELIETQNAILGYIEYKNSAKKGMGYVTNINTKYSPKITMYLFDTGETITYKMSKKDYSERPFEKGTILKYVADRRNRSRLVDGKWVKQPDEYDWWINNFVIV